MKIIITENQYLKVSGELDEEKGVPEGILEAGEELYDLIVQKIENFNGSLFDLEKNSIKFKKDFIIGDNLFDSVEVRFNFDVDPDADEVMVSNQYSVSKLELNDLLLFKSKKNPNEIIVGFSFIILKDTKIQDIVSILKKDREKHIISLTHELGHTFINVKQKFHTLKSKTMYTSNNYMLQNLKLTDDLYDFLYNLYFIHAAENSVRPIELAQYLRLNKMTKENFLKLFSNNEVVQRLKEMQSFNYETFKKNLEKTNNLNQIKMIIILSGSDYKGKTNEQIVHEFLKSFVRNVIVSRNKVLETFLREARKSIILSEDSLVKYLKNFVKENMKYKDNPDEFFKMEEKNFHIQSTKLLKKLSKLYDYTFKNPS